MIRKAKAVMEEDIAKDVKNNPKPFWKNANSKRKTKSGISELKYKLGQCRGTGRILQQCLHN